MTPKYASYVYIPPRSLPYAEAFYRNIRHYKHTHELVLFSDREWDVTVEKIKDPEVVKHARENDGRHKSYAVSNLLWLTALMLAHRNSVTHMLYLEADCRVGCDGWDETIFDEFESLTPLAINAGSVMVWNPREAGFEAKEAFDNAIHKWWGRRTERVPEVFTERSHLPCAYANGCGSIIDVAWAANTFCISDTVNAATRIAPWDHEIGKRLWKEFGPAAYEKVAHLPSVFSTYGDGCSTESERLKILHDGKAVLVHQVKSNINYP